MATRQRIVPVLVYADIAAARDFLVEAFGFTAGDVRRDDDSGGVHCEVALDGDIVRLHSVAPHDGLRCVADLGAASGTLDVFVDDVDEHHDRAAAAGAVVMHPPTDQLDGLRAYSVADSEGRTWSFSASI